MDVLGSKHFEQQLSASHTSTLLEAAAEVGLDADAAAAFLETDELEDYVWQSYGDTIKKHDIRAIPYFIFGPEGMWSPFRPEGQEEPIIVSCVERLTTAHDHTTHASLSHIPHMYLTPTFAR